MRSGSGPIKTWSANITIAAELISLRLLPPGMRFSDAREFLEIGQQARILVKPDEGCFVLVEQLQRLEAK
ncbi:hypothetical protein BraRD5C2_53070 [Bradyrhizobium sp. RD5-C2]|nr:hypothetical protein BraRD5C2_53070 [Bradyrhizobium sp. RD5-C2]